MIASSPASIAECIGLFPAKPPVRKPEHRWIALESDFSPVKFGELQEDHNAAQEQVHKGNYGYPMADPRIEAMAIDPFF